jgi:hypothetical protein
LIKSKICFALLVYRFNKCCYRTYWQGYNICVCFASTEPCRTGNKMQHAFIQAKLCNCLCFLPLLFLFPLSLYISLAFSFLSIFRFHFHFHIFSFYFPLLISFIFIFIYLLIFALSFIIFIRDSYSSPYSPPFYPSCSQPPVYLLPSLLSVPHSSCSLTALGPTPTGFAKRHSALEVPRKKRKVSNPESHSQEH